MTGSAALALTVQHTREDHARLIDALNARVAGGWGPALSLAPAVAAVAALAAGVIAATAAGLDGAFPLAIGAGLALFAAQLVSAALDRRLRRRQLADAGLFLRPFAFDADAEGVTVRTDVAATRLAWTGVLAIETAPGLVLLYTDAAAALALPSRAFPDAAAQAAFVERIRALREAAIGQTGEQA